jgi:predicted transcriptional regulator
VTADDTTIDGVRLSDVTLSDLGLRPSQPIVLRVAVARSAVNVGGLNLFGRAFGNYPQDIVLRIDYEMADPSQP